MGKRMTGMSLGGAGRAAAAIVIVVMGSGVARAQSADVDAPEPIVVAPVTVTATRNPIEAFEYPGMVTVIGPSDIRARQASTPDDILRFMPNVEFTGGPRRTAEAPSIRGFDGPDVVVLFDGVRQNFGSTHDGRFFMDPSLLKRVEALRGPASSLYGSGGTGGVIEFRTIEAADFLDADQRFGLSVAAGGRSANGERVGTVTSYGAPIERMDFVASVTRRTSGPIRLGDGSKLNDTEDDIVAGLAKLGFVVGAHQRLEGAFTRFDNDAVEPNIGGGAGSGGQVGKIVASDTWRLSWRYDNLDDKLFDTDVVLYRNGVGVDEIRRDSEGFSGLAPVGEHLKRDVDTIGLRFDNRSRLEMSETSNAVFTLGRRILSRPATGGG